MDIHELVAACDRSIKQWEESKREWCDYPPLPLVLEGYPTGDKMRLFKKIGPYCESIANSVEGRGTVCYFDARKIKKYVQGMGLK